MKSLAIRAGNSLWLCLPVVGLVWLLWLGLQGPLAAWQTLTEGWAVALTMVFGSFVAGASSVGGGAVAFPVLTKLLEVEPNSAKLFSLAIQSVGMTSASYLIWRSKIPVHWRAIGLASLGGVVGVTSSLLFLAPVLPTNDTRVFFTALQAAFALVLVIKLRSNDYQTQGSAEDQNNAPEATAEQPVFGRSDAALLVMAGMCGGVASGIVGCGIDLVVFSVLVLRLGISEKIATPTSVIVMAINSLVGMAVYRVGAGPVPEDVFRMWLSAVPVVVFGAPLGAFCCAQVHRSTIARVLVLLILIEVGSTLLLIPIQGQTLLVAMSSLTFFGCVFYGLYRNAAPLGSSFSQAEY